MGKGDGVFVFVTFWVSVFVLFLLSFPTLVLKIVLNWKIRNKNLGALKMLPWNSDTYTNAISTAAVHWRMFSARKGEVHGVWELTRTRSILGMCRGSKHLRQELSCLVNEDFRASGYDDKPPQLVTIHSHTVIFKNENNIYVIFFSLGAFVVVSSVCRHFFYCFCN